MSIYRVKPLYFREWLTRGSCRKVSEGWTLVNQPISWLLVTGRSCLSVGLLWILRVSCKKTLLGSSGPSGFSAVKTLPVTNWWFSVIKRFFSFIWNENPAFNAKLSKLSFEDWISPKKIREKEAFQFLIKLSRDFSFSKHKNSNSKLHHPISRIFYTFVVRIWFINQMSRIFMNTGFLYICQSLQSFIFLLESFRQYLVFNHMIKNDSRYFM